MAWFNWASTSGGRDFGHELARGDFGSKIGLPGFEVAVGARVDRGFAVGSKISGKGDFRFRVGDGLDSADVSMIFMRAAS